MAERITAARVRERAFALNRILRARGSDARYFAQRRNGYTGLDRYQRVSGRWGEPPGERCEMISGPIIAGTSGEVYRHLGGMIEALEALERPNALETS